MGQPRIVLAGACPALHGLRWEFERPLRIGRQASADIALDDASISRQHAEVFPNCARWLVRDLAGNERYPTLLNGVRVGSSEQRLRRDDVLRCGNLSFRVSEIELYAPPLPSTLPEPPASTTKSSAPDSIRVTGNFLRVQASAQNTWDEAMQAVTVRSGRKEQHLLTLLRTGHHLSHISHLDELLRSVLADAVASLDAQRGSIFLAHPRTGELSLRTCLAPSLPSSAGRWASRTLAVRCFQKGESILCRDVSVERDLVAAVSVQRGRTSSLVCALLRSPRKRIGVLQLDRGPFQDPFVEDDFYLADAVAAQVSIGIESALLVEEQREQFLQTVTSLARTVEVRDQYTGDHTRRVTDYALVLADALEMSAAERDQIIIGTPLHDIGKVGITDDILRKPGRLTGSEFEIMKTHTILGANILETVFNLNQIIPIVRHHHERWDGRGYPDRLAGDRIARTARVVAVADAFDAMTSNRPYRNALPVERAFAELQVHAGTHFDPECVAAFLRVQSHIEEVLARKCDSCP